MPLLLLLAGLARANGCDDAYTTRTDALFAPGLLDVLGGVVSLYTGSSLLSDGGTVGAPQGDAATALTAAGTFAGGLTMMAPAALHVVEAEQLRRARRLLREARVGDGLALRALTDRLESEGVADLTPARVAASLVRGDDARVFCPGGIPAPQEDLATWVRVELSAPTAPTSTPAGAP